MFGILASADNIAENQFERLMGRQHTIAKVYPVSAQTLWNDIIDPSALAASMKGSLTYSGLPTEPAFLRVNALSFR